MLERVRHLHPQLIDLSLDRIERLLAALGHPEQNLPSVIHVAGTNGKGSTIAFLRSLLTAGGYKVQAYTSPHLVNFHERIRLTDGFISEAKLTDALARCEAANGGASITYFEITTAAAILAFAEDHAENQADYCLLEVGLGGRYDATKVIETPAATIITPVDLDHQNFLGDTIAKIAHEKAGIMRPDVPAFVGKQPLPALEIIYKCAKEVGAFVQVADINWTIEPGSQSWRLSTSRDERDLPIPGLAGPHQLDNAALAIACLDGIGVELSPEAIITGLTTVSWPGRLQKIEQGPLQALLGTERTLWLDGGHNVHAARALAAAFTGQKIDIVTGMMATKDADAILSAMAPVLNHVHAIPVPGESAHEPDVLIAAAASAGVPGTAYKTIEDALAATKTMDVLICGSLYLAGQVLEASGLIPE